jgi:protocatechuate 3,4-dioxygenase beta subunit
MGALLHARTALAECLRSVRTDEGPFYPTTPIPELQDLTGRDDGRAKGRILYVMGRVTDSRCAPLAGVRVEVWQCDGNGLYWHPRAAAQDELDPHFAYFAHAVTKGDGRYGFRTIVPSRYTFMGLERAPHIHFKVKHPDYRELVTEMYFAGEADDAIRVGDRVWLSRPAETRHRLIIAPVEPERFEEQQGLRIEEGSLGCTFDLQLDAREA